MDRNRYEGRGNPAPYPFNGGRAAIDAWQKKEDEMLAAAEGIPPAGKSDAELVNDVLRLPTGAADLAASLKKTLATTAMGSDEKQTCLMRLLVASKRCGGLPAEVIVDAVQELHNLQMLDQMRVNAELEDEIRSLRAANNRAEREVIDALADKLFDFTKEFVVSECKRRVESLQARVIAKSSQVGSEGDAIERLNAKAVLLDGRVRYLELTSPIWVSANTHS